MGEKESALSKESVLSKNFVEELSNQSRQFCIIGLTGRVRSGTSDVCSLLTDLNFPKLMDSPNVYQGESEQDAREYLIIHRYLSENWKPFVELNVTSVIISYVLDLGDKLPELSLPILPDNKAETIGSKFNNILKKCVNSDKEGVKFQDSVRSSALLTDDILSYNFTLEKQNNEKVKSENEKRKEALRDACSKLFEKFPDLKEKAIFESWNKTKKYLNSPIKSHAGQSENDLKEFYQAFVFCFGVLPALEKAFKEGPLKDAFPIAFQSFGNNIRATGSVSFSDQAKDKINSENLFALPSRVNRFIKLLRRYPLSQSQADQLQERRTPVYVVINNFKNIFEAYYFKRRYSAFFLLAVSCDEEKRRENFKERDNYYLANLREDLSSGKKIFKFVDSKNCNAEKINEKYRDDNAKLKFAQQLSEPSDSLRYISYKQNLAPFILQDVVTCIENADIFVTRNYDETKWTFDKQLIRQLGRVVALIFHPGMLTPTRIERCMQIAMTAKLNSGCLSRQVGAVVTDKDYNILSLGWNDAPCGAESCLRRNFFDLAQKSDKGAYSKYELENEEYRSYVDKVNAQLSPRKRELNGLPMAFCFKDIYQDIIKQRDQIYTRALHGEERALAACDNERAKEGYLFTTSSPCELCAKRAKEAGISRIYYIEQYPGISRSHVTQIGPDATQAQYEFFVGAVGLAYIKLYTPLIPYKDELAALNFSPSSTYKSINEKDKPKPGTPPQDDGDDESEGPGHQQYSQISQECQTEQS